MHIRRLSALVFILFILGGSNAWAGKAVPASASDTCPIKVGESIPALTLSGLDAKPVDLNALVAKKPTVLIFYRGSWCPYCNTHLGELQTVEGDLKALGYQVVAVSPDLPKNLKTSVAKNDLSYTLLSDSQVTAAKALGLAFRLDDETYKTYLNYDINLEKASGEKHHVLPIPAAIVLDTEGTVQFVFSSPDYKVRVNKEVLLAAAKAAVKAKD